MRVENITKPNGVLCQKVMFFPNGAKTIEKYDASGKDIVYRLYFGKKSSRRVSFKKFICPRLIQKQRGV